MSREFHTIRGDGYRAIATRNDRPWGHAIDVELYELNGAKLGSISFVCSPEFEDFDFYQGQSTEQLLAIVAERLKAALGQYIQAWEVGLHVYVRFNGLDDAQLNARANGPEKHRPAP